MPLRRVESIPSLIWATASARGSVISTTLRSCRIHLFLVHSTCNVCVCMHPSDAQITHDRCPPLAHLPPHRAHGLLLCYWTVNDRWPGGCHDRDFVRAEYCVIHACASGRLRARSAVLFGKLLLRTRKAALRRLSEKVWLLVNSTCSLHKPERPSRHHNSSRRSLPRRGLVCCTSVRVGMPAVVSTKRHHH